MQLSFLFTLFPLGRALFPATGASATINSLPSSDSDSSLSSSDYGVGEDYATQDPLHIGAMPPVAVHSTSRQRIEKAHLLKRMNRKSEKWGTSHPRYRLLESLFGFTKYRERNLAELDRWRGLYKNVGVGQMQVRCQQAFYTLPG